MALERQHEALGEGRKKFTRQLFIQMKTKYKHFFSCGSLKIHTFLQLFSFIFVQHSDKARRRTEDKFASDLFVQSTIKINTSQLDHITKSRCLVCFVGKDLISSEFALIAEKVSK